MRGGGHMREREKHVCDEGYWNVRRICIVYARDDGVAKSVK